MTRLTLTAAPALLVLALALAGCAATPGSTGSPVPEASASDPGSDECAEVTVVVDFGVLDEPAVVDCVSAGFATDVFDAAEVTTEGTVDYGDQVVCRVNGEPSADETVTVEGAEPFVETCETLNAAAYWALWVKPTADSEWEYAQEGASTLELTDGESVGLVYTAGVDSTPPQG